MFVIFSAGKFSAAGQAGCGATNTPHPREAAVAVPTIVGESPTHQASGQGQGMSSALTGNPQVQTSFPPFVTVRQDASAAARTKVREQMRQFMTKGPIDFSSPESLQSRI